MLRKLLILGSACLVAARTTHDVTHDTATRRGHGAPPAADGNVAFDARGGAAPADGRAAPADGFAAAAARAGGRRLACADDVLWIKDAKSDKEDIKTCETLAEIRAEGKKFRKGKRKGKKHNKKWKHFCKKWKGSVGGEVMTSMKAKDACAATCGTCDPMADALVTDPFDPKGFMEQDASNQETPW